jgi:hypothetical protein
MSTSTSTSVSMPRRKPRAEVRALSALSLALCLGCGASAEDEQMMEPAPQVDRGAWDTGVPAETAVKDLSAAQVITLCKAVKAEAERAQLAMMGKKIACYTIGILLSGGMKDKCEAQVASCLAMDWKEMPRCEFSVPGAPSCAATVAEVKACSDGQIAATKAAHDALSCPGKLPMIGKTEACTALYAKCPGLDPSSKP